MANQVSDGLPASLPSEIVYVLDARMTIDEIEQFIAENQVYGYDAMLEFAIAEKLFEQSRWDEATVEFENLIAKYPFSGVASFAEEDVIILKQIASILEEGTSSDFLLGKLLYYSDEPIFYNQCWLERRRELLEENHAPDSYFWSNNDYLRASLLFERFARQNPTHPLAEESLFMAGKSYEMAAVHGFLANEDMVAEIRKRAIDTYRRYLDLYLDSDRERTDEAIQAIGLIWLHKLESFDSVLDLYEEEELERMREEFLAFVQERPNHHLANNLLNWVAWSHCLEANLHPLGSPDYEYHYYRAAELYQRIIDEYPLGLTWENARKRSNEIKEKLQNPSATQEEQWYWYGFGEIDYFQDRECFFVPSGLDQLVVTIGRQGDVSVELLDSFGTAIEEGSFQGSVHTTLDEQTEWYEDVYAIAKPQPGFWCTRGPEGRFFIYTNLVP
jgi:tetratricopeptide (TPR) repeat protein